MLIPPGRVDFELHSLRCILKRIMREVQDLEILGTLVPRIANAAANLIRADTTVSAKGLSPDMSAMQQALRDLMEERDVEENTRW